ncbi:hypothetical protein Dimus_031307 [Dionaea muscipula]
MEWDKVLSNPVKGTKGSMNQATLCAEYLRGPRSQGDVDQTNEMSYRQHMAQMTTHAAKMSVLTGGWLDKLEELENKDSQIDALKSKNTRIAGVLKSWKKERETWTKSREEHERFKKEMEEKMEKEIAKKKGMEEMVVTLKEVVATHEREKLAAIEQENKIKEMKAEIDMLKDKQVEILIERDTAKGELWQARADVGDEKDKNLKLKTDLKLLQDTHAKLKLDFDAKVDEVFEHRRKSSEQNFQKEKAEFKKLFGVLYWMNEKREALAAILPAQMERARQQVVHDFVLSEDFLRVATPIAVPFIRNGFKISQFHAKKALSSSGQRSDWVDQLELDHNVDYQPEPEVAPAPEDVPSME